MLSGLNDSGLALLSVAAAVVLLFALAMVSFSAWVEWQAGKGDGE